MNIKTLAKQWLIEHEHYEHEPSFENDLQSLCELLQEVAYHEGYICIDPEYDPQFGDDKLCECGHVYYRHFDPYDDMSPVGCKYCHSHHDFHIYDKCCPYFKEKKNA